MPGRRSSPRAGAPCCGADNRELLHTRDRVRVSSTPVTTFCGGGCGVIAVGRCFRSSIYRGASARAAGRTRVALPRDRARRRRGRWTRGSIAWSRRSYSSGRAGGRAMNASATAIVRVQLDDRSSRHRRLEPLGARPRATRSCRGGSRGAVIVSNETVAPLYGERLAAALAPLYPKVEGSSRCPTAKPTRTWQTLQTLFDAMLAAHCDRSTPRCSPSAAAWSAIWPASPPRATCAASIASRCRRRCSPRSTLRSAARRHQPPRQEHDRRVPSAVAVIAESTASNVAAARVVAGLAEVIKYGAIADDSFLGWIETNLGPCSRATPPPSARRYTRPPHQGPVVAGDEREAGRRAILNFGHTFAHAIETGLGPAAGFTAKPSAAAWRWRPTSPRASA